MTVVAVAGDCATTTTVALAAAWPDGVRVLEADPSGGSLAAWFDVPATPSLATVVAGTTDDRMPAFDAAVRDAPAGIRFVPAPTRSRAAHRAVEEAAVDVLPALARQRGVVLADVGALRVYEPVPAACRAATVALLVHRQASGANAEAVRVERLVEQVEHLQHTAAAVVLATIGAVPFDPAEVEAFVDAAVPGAIVAAVRLADDALGAAVIAGRTGVSPRRCARLPLMRSAGGAAAVLAAIVAERAPAPSDRGGR